MTHPRILTTILALLTVLYLIGATSEPDAKTLYVSPYGGELTLECPCEQTENTISLRSCRGADSPDDTPTGPVTPLLRLAGDSDEGDSSDGNGDDDDGSGEDGGQDDASEALRVPMRREGSAS